MTTEQPTDPSGAASRALSISPQGRDGSVKKVRAAWDEGRGETPPS